MNSTYHLKSAQDINTDFLDSVKSLYKSKAITIIVAEDSETNNELSDSLIDILEERLREDESTYLTADDTLALLKKKYGL